MDGGISWEVKYCRQCSGVGSGLACEVELSGLQDFKDCGLSSHMQSSATDVSRKIIPVRL